MRAWSRGPLLSLLACLVSGGAALGSLHRALGIDPPPVARPAAPSPEALLRDPKEAVSPQRLALAVDKDPFHPERRRPGERFRMPGEGAVRHPAPPAESGAIRLIGTAVMPAGQGFAMCQAGSEAPKLVRVGERIGDLTLKAVERGKAVFLTRAGARMEVRVAKAGT